MKKVIKQILLITTILALCLNFTGCKEDSSKAKLVASENMRLKNELKQKEEQIKDLREKLDKCLKENKKLKEESKKNIQELVGGMFDTVVTENAKLKEENKQLKKKIQQLKK